MHITLLCLFLELFGFLIDFNILIVSIVWTLKGYSLIDFEKEILSFLADTSALSLLAAHMTFAVMTLAFAGRITAKHIGVPQGFFKVPR